MEFFGVNTSKFELINYVALNKDLEKLTTKAKAEPKLYSIKMKICFDQRYNDIGVVIAMKWRHNLFYLQPYSSAPIQDEDIYNKDNYKHVLYPLVTEGTLSNPLQ